MTNETRTDEIKTLWDKANDNTLSDKDIIDDLKKQNNEEVLK